MTTPGTLVEPGKFFRDVFFEVRHYLAGHYEYTVPRGPAHLVRMLVYLGAEFFSRLTSSSRSPLARSRWPEPQP